LNFLLIQTLHKPGLFGNNDLGWSHATRSKQTSSFNRTLRRILLATSLQEHNKRTLPAWGVFPFRSGWRRPIGSTLLPQAN